jgi:hypothetical protein
MWGEKPYLYYECPRKEISTPVTPAAIEYEWEIQTFIKPETITHEKLNRDFKTTPHTWDGMKFDTRLQALKYKEDHEDELRDDEDVHIECYSKERK